LRQQYERLRFRPNFHSKRQCIGPFVCLVRCSALPSPPVSSSPLLPMQGSLCIRSVSSWFLTLFGTGPSLGSYRKACCSAARTAQFAPKGKVFVFGRERQDPFAEITNRVWPYQHRFAFDDPLLRGSFVLRRDSTAEQHRFRPAAERPVYALITSSV